MQLEIVTPIRPLLTAEVSDLVVPGEAGEFGVLPGHKPLLAQLGTGVLSFRERGGGATQLVVSGGLAEVLDDRITVLAEYACRADEVDLAAEQADQAKLEEKLRSTALLDDDAHRLQHELERTRASMAIVLRK
ncbi:MAG: ATP synthase F1 subunit epsilon [Deltaproteobacteria bacterium]|nr:ATP synthase F1 subunit epsilon [Deltaproteobacteria bacterium]